MGAVYRSEENGNKEMGRSNLFTEPPSEHETARTLALSRWSDASALVLPK